MKVLYGEEESMKEHTDCAEDIHPEQTLRVLP